MVAFATQVKRRRGTTAQNDAFTGAEGEIVVDMQKHTLRVHDGETLGGFEIARQTDLNDKADASYVNSQLGLKADADLGNIPTNYDYVVESQEPTADNGFTWYRKYKSGWVEQGGSYEIIIGTDNTLFSISLPVEMANVRYTASVNVRGGWATENVAQIENNTKTVLSGYAKSSNSSTKNILWQVSGIAAQ